jgi:predicted MFS family arabinose efflux permease
MPTLIKPDQLPAGNALSSAMMQAGSLAGPVLGGILVATAGSAAAFAADAASFAVSAVTLAFISARKTAAVGEVPEGATADGSVCAGAADAGSDQPSPAGPTLWQLLRTARLLQVLLVVTIAANLASGGTFDVALPALAHARFGAAGYGALLACFGAGALLGTLYAARAGTFARPAIVAMMAFLAMAIATGLLPFLWGLPGAAAAILILGTTNGFGNVVFITLIQQWAPSQLLGRVMSLVMLASLGSFPLSVALSGLLVRHIGPSPFFPIAGGLVVLSVAGALGQREVRMLGAGKSAAADQTTVRA